MPYKNKEDQNKAAQRWYEKNKVQHIANKNRCQKARSKKYRLKLIKLFGGKCQNPGCGYEKHLQILEFHHRNNKEDYVTRLINGGFSWKKILAEAKKCELLCPNCHRTIHLVK